MMKWPDPSRYGSRSWFPFRLSRIPGTPVTMIGRFQQGRASIELNLAADRCGLHQPEDLEETVFFCAG